MPAKLRLGVSANCSTLVKYMHPGKLINDTIRKRVSRTRITNLIVVRQDTKIVNTKEQPVIVFHHGDFDGKEIYCVKRWVKVEIEGPEEHIFESTDNAEDNAVNPTMILTITTT